MKVVAYASGVLRGPKNQFKRDILTRFIQGVKSKGDSGLVHNGPEPVPCDVAFIQGWVHEASPNTPHLVVRRKVIEYQQRMKQRTLVADSNLFNYVNGNETETYLRYSFDGIFPVTGNYFWDNPDPARWKKISSTLGLQLKDWRTNGNHILICTQRNGGWSMKKLDVVQWLNNTVAEIRKYSDRPIIVRPHPGDKNAIDYISKNPNKNLYYISNKKLLTQDFKDAWAVVTHNSSPGVAGAIEGVPVFVTDPNPQYSQACDVSNHSLSLIEQPVMPERQAWVEKISMSHWDKKETLSGEAWEHIKKFV